MKVNYRKVILLFFLIMSAMFLVIATTSGCSNDDEVLGNPEPNPEPEHNDEPKLGPADGGGLTCAEGHGYKIAFAKPEFEKAFVVGGKDGDLDRNISVKVDQLTRANGFGAAMPEFRSLYPTMKAANDDEGALAKSNDGIIGLWGSYFVENADLGALLTGHGANAGLSKFILGLDISNWSGTNDGSGDIVSVVPGVKTVKLVAGTNAAVLTTPLTSGPAGLNGANVAWADYAANAAGAASVGGTFHAIIPNNAIAPIDRGWDFTSIGRLENFSAAIDVGGNPPVKRAAVFTAPALVGGQSWALDAANKGDTKLAAAAAGIQNTYDPAKGWQKLFSIVPCDETVKNGLIAAQLTKSGFDTKVADSLTAADKLTLIRRPPVALSPRNDITTILSNADGDKKRAMYVDSFVGGTISSIVVSLGFATINYNLDADAALISDEKFHTFTKLALLCRAIITGISSDQEEPLTTAAAAIGDVKADKFTGGAEKMDCYLGITNVYPEWYAGVVAADKADNGGSATNTLDKQFKAEAVAADRKKFGNYDTQTKRVGLVIADTGDVVLNSVESHALFYTGAGTAAEQQTKWGEFIEQEGVKTTYGTLTFKFIRPDIK